MGVRGLLLGHAGHGRRMPSDSEEPLSVSTTTIMDFLQLQDCSQVVFLLVTKTVSLVKTYATLIHICRKLQRRPVLIHNLYW